MKSKITIKRLACALLCALMLCLSATAVGAARMPSNRGIVTDDANVLSAQTAADIDSYAEELDNETDVKLHVALVHFLDGMDAQSYADALFAEWRLGDDDLLLLGAAGEDSFAVSMGADVREKLGTGTADTLMFTSSGFSNLFRAQRYDEAFGSFFVAFNSLVEKRYGETIELGDMFASAQPSAAATPAPEPDAREYGSQLWSEVMDAIQKDRDDSYQTYHETRRYDYSNGIGVGGWIVLGIIIFIIFGQSDPVRKARRQGGRDYRRMGCGCSPLGWIFSIMGLGVLINNLKGRRQG